MFEPQNAHTETLELASFIIGAAYERAQSIVRQTIDRKLLPAQGESHDPQSNFDRTFSGYCAEAAVACFLGLDPIRKGDHFQNRPDVGGYDVFCSKRHNAGLIFTPRNLLWSVKILVIDENPVFHICGCYRCDDARDHTEWWKEPRPGGGCWIVPQAFLRAVREVAPDTIPISEQRKRELEQFSQDWRAELAKEGIEPPKYNPLTAAIAKHQKLQRGR